MYFESFSIRCHYYLIQKLRIKTRLYGAFILDSEQSEKASSITLMFICYYSVNKILTRSTSIFT